MQSRDSGPDPISETPRYRTRRSILASVGGTAFVGLAGCSSTSQAPSTETSSSQPDVDHEDYDGDAFTGRLTADVGSDQPASVAPGRYEGTIVYDQSCKSVGEGLTGCDAGIETAELGTINFYYEHNMADKPCLTPDQQVVLEVGESQATVQRKVDESE